MTNIQKEQIGIHDLNRIENESQKEQIPQEQLRREVDYARAQRILDSMLLNGLISLSEFNKITELNRKSFSPALARIMPKIP